MKKYKLLIFIVLFYITGTPANTTRDLKAVPDYNPLRIKKLIILHINLERINNGRPSFIMNRNLNAAAQWHSDYMSEQEKLFHIASEKGMHDILQRVTFFGEKVNSYAEIISSVYSISAERLPFTKKKDNNGEYIDFGKNEVYWLSETEIAMLMKRSILNNPAYVKYILHEPFNSIGGGITPGNINSLKGWYGSFAIVEKRDVIRLKLQIKFEKYTVRKKINGKEKEKVIVKYFISGFRGLKAALLAVSGSGSFRVFDFTVMDGRLDFRIDDEFRQKLNDDDRLYAASYDEENDTYYPVSRIDVLK